MQTCVTRYRAFHAPQARTDGTLSFTHITYITRKRVCVGCRCVCIYVYVGRCSVVTGAVRAAHLGATANAFLRGLKSFISYKWGLLVRRCAPYVPIKLHFARARDTASHSDISPVRPSFISYLQLFYSPIPSQSGLDGCPVTASQRLRVRRPKNKVARIKVAFTLVSSKRRLIRDQRISQWCCRRGRLI